MEYGETQHADFIEHGYVRLGKVVDDAELAELQQRINAIMLGEFPYPEMDFQLDGDNADYAKMPAVTPGHKGATLQYRKIMGLEQDPVFLGYMQHAFFRQLTRRYMGEDVSIFRAMFMNKPAEQGTVLPWHQDVGVGWGVDNNPITTVWTALDAATVENGCMQIVPGSHKHGVITEKHFPSAEQLAECAPPGSEMDLVAEAGEAILLNNLLLHRSGLNSTGQPRRAFSTAYMDGASRSVRTGQRYPMIFGEGALVAV
ncbi:MAG: phytanoyl-CoA dioxygenase family protein [Candidatus Latescibacterota bacterium]|jgi:phytanoyl-CoA hydroxylase